MRGPSALLTPLLVAAVALVAGVAVADSLWPRGGRSAPPSASRPLGDADAQRALARLEASGALHYVDRTCVRRSLDLPQLVRGPAQRVACVDELRPRRPVPGVSAFPDGRPRAGCRRATSEFVEGRRLLRRLAGCANAARPDGLVVDTRGEAIVARRPSCPARSACERTVVPARVLRDAARTHPNVPPRPFAFSISVRDVAWLGAERYAVLLAADVAGRVGRLGPQAVLALVDGRRVVSARPFIGAPPDALAVSPRGSFIATTGVLTLAGHDGSSLPVAPPFVRGHAVAWSPDERLVAVATRTGVLVVSTVDLLAHAETGAAPSLLRIPLAVRELAWAARG